MKRKIGAFVSSVILFAGGFFFNSCQNFMSGSKIQKEVQEALEIANSQQKTYFVLTDKDSGSVTPEQIKGNKKDSFDLIFTPSENWQFICWEVIDTKTGRRIPDAIKFDPVDKKQTKATIINPSDNIYIHPKCVQVPVILSVEPKTQAYANTPIIIKFNIPVEDKQIQQADSLFTFENNNIELNCNGINISDLFEAPVFNEDKTELKIFPKSNMDKGVLLKDYIINELNVGSVEIQISFSDEIKIINNEIEFNLTNQKFSVYYIPTTDSQSPTKYNLIVSRDSSLSLENGETFTGNKFHQENIAEKDYFSLNEEEKQEYKDAVFNNACNGTVYIYGRYFDNDSGVKSVIVSEIMTNVCYDATQVYDADLFITEYTEDSPEAIFKTVNNETVFLIKHVIKTQSKSDKDDGYGGAVSFDVFVNDYCYNSTESEHYTIIATWNFRLGGYGIDENHETTILSLTDWTDYDLYKTSLQNYIKSVYFNFAYDDYDIYNWCALDENTLFLELQILDKKNQNNTKHIEPNFEPRTPDPDNDDFYDLKVTFNLNDYEIQPDTVVKLVITDFLGHISEDVIWDFSESNYGVIPNIFENENKKYVEFYDANGTPLIGYYLTRKNSSNQIQCVSNFSKDKELEPGYSYGLMINGLLYQNYSFSVDNTALQRPSEIQIDSIDIKKSNNKASLIVEAKLNAASLVGFDTICYTGRSDSNTKLSEGESTISVEIPDDYIHGGIYTEDGKYKVFTVYGFKNNMRTNGTDCKINVYDRTQALTVDQSIKNQYDNTPPRFALNAKGAYIEITMSDDWSGIKEGTVEIKGKSLTFTSTNDTRQILVWQVLDSANDYSYIHFTGSDNAGNVIDEYELTKKCVDPVYAKIVFDEDKYKIKDSIFCNYCMGYDFTNDSSSENYGFPSVFNVPAFGERIPKSNFFTETYIKGHFADKQYIKIIPYDNSSYRVWCFSFANPLYYYNGEPGNQENDFLIPNGNSKESVVIGSDKPVYVHTVATWLPLSECKNWDYSEWEYYRQEYGERILDCESSPIKVYTIPMDKIEKGQNYIVIAHYSNNNVLMSEVMTK